MQIKSKHTTSILTPLWQLVIALAVVVLLIVVFGKAKNWGGKKQRPISVLPTATVDFMNKEKSLPELLAFFPEHTILLAVKDEASTNLGADMREIFTEMEGHELSKLAFRDSYVGVIEKGKFIQEKRSAKEAVNLKYGDMKITSASMPAGNYSRLQIGDFSTEAQKRGLIAFVIGKNGFPIGRWTFDFFKKTAPTSVGEADTQALLVDIPVIELELKEKHFAKLKKKRDEAIGSGVLLVGDEDLVPAKVFFEGKKMKSDIRLKGDWTDHLLGENWSFRVKLDKDDRLKGMRKFSLHRPETRNYFGEWLFHQLLVDADIPNLQYHFVQVKLRVTGASGSTEKMLGLYALEEAFDKALIERGERREGVLLKVDEDPIWQERADFIASGIDIKELANVGIADYENLNILPFGEKRIREDSSLLRQFLMGAKLFRDYLSNKRPIHEVFEVEKLAKYNAICNLLGANHALIAHNYRVYYNPVTARLEPVGFDGNAWHQVNYFFPYHQAGNDPVYMAALARALEEVCSDEYFEKVVNWPGLAEQMALHQKLYPEVRLTVGMLEHNRKVIQRNLHPTRCLNVFFNEMDGQNMHLTIENYGKYPVEISSLQNTGGRVFAKPIDAGIVNPNERRTMSFELDKNFNRIFVQKAKKKSEFQPLQDMGGVEIAYNTLGINKLKTESILPWNTDLAYSAKEDPIRQAPNAHQYDWLVFNEETKTITCQPGLHQLENALIVPEGYVLKANPGCRIDLISNFSKIISYSPVTFLGSTENPIEIFSSTGNGHGMLVVNVADTSRFENCRFIGLSNPMTKGWALTGAVNFYEAPVLLSNCSFSKNRCEDALNIFRSWFEMDKVIFTDIHADAFDGDFVNGTVQNSQFGQIGNDAIDVSGSDIIVDNVAIIAAGDKGLSAGENSQMIARNVVVKNSEVALASKDKSTLTITQSILKDNALVFTSFQKKPEFGPAHIIADSLALSGNTLNFLIETNSTLRLNGQFMPTEDGVIERMYGEEFGRKSER